MNFKESLKNGRVGESIIAKYFMKKGYNILPVYENNESFKGPTVYKSDNSRLVAPDMIVFNPLKMFWVEAKHKSAFSWHRKTKRWVTGIDIKHYKDYLQVKDLVNFELWLLFLHKDGVAKDTPEDKVSPCGLFGNSINFLSENINHKSDKWGNSGMVYWGVEKLKFIESLENLGLKEINMNETF